MDVDRILRQVTMAHGAFFVPRDKWVSAHFWGERIPRKQIDSICLVAQQSHQLAASDKTKECDIFYITFDAYRLVFSWIDYGMLVFIFDTNASIAIILDLIQATSQKLNDHFREAMSVKQDLEHRLQQYQTISQIARDTLGALGPELIQTVLNDLKLDPTSPSGDELRKFANSIQRAAGLIIGPSRAAEMARKMTDSLNK